MGSSARTRTLALGAGAALLLGAWGCGAFARVLGVQAPVFEVATERESFLTLDPASVVAGRPVATLRVWTRVTNPNDFGFTLSRLQGLLFLEDREVADLDLPLGLPLPPVADTVIPLDVRFGLPALGALGALGDALLRRTPVAYRFDGVVSLDAGRFGTPTFGPRTWLRGQVEVRPWEDESGGR